jgi:hypothetical protein
VIDPEVYKIFSYVIYPIDQGTVKGFKILHDNAEEELERLNKDAVNKVIFILKPRREIVERAASWKKIFEGDKKMLDAYFLYVPRRTCECDDLMNSLGVRSF